MKSICGIFNKRAVRQGLLVGELTRKKTRSSTYRPYLQVEWTHLVLVFLYDCRPLRTNWTSAHLPALLVSTAHRCRSWTLVENHPQSVDVLSVPWCNTSDNFWNQHHKVTIRCLKNDNNVAYHNFTFTDWRCLLGGRKGFWSVKKLSVGGAGVVVCLERGADLHIAQLMPLPLTVSCFSKIQTGFYLSATGSPG